MTEKESHGMTNFPPENVGWLTSREAAAYLRMGSNFLDYDRCKKTVNIPFYRIGRRIRYKRSDLDAFLEKNRVN